MKFQTQRKILGINVLLFALLFLSVTFNKENLRPLVTNDSIASVLTGSFPNFIAAYLVSLAAVNAVLIRKPKHGRLIIYLSSSFVFFILTIEEVKPMWGASTHYDLFDIFASGIGSLLAVLTFELIVLWRINKSKNNPDENPGY
ncbi:MAG: hypothetical protein KAI29_28190 [Cyclobacteriaceae bacterium]|nr:hypothetical protein [Cyclobacteriaceae bacterium]